MANYGLAAGQQNSPIKSSRTDEVVKRLEYCLGEFDNLYIRLSVVADKLLGCVPECAENSKAQLDPVANGFFDQLDSAGVRFDKRICALRTLAARFDSL